MKEDHSLYHILLKLGVLCFLFAGFLEFSYLNKEENLNQFKQSLRKLEDKTDKILLELKDLKEIEQVSLKTKNN